MSGRSPRDVEPRAPPLDAAAPAHAAESYARSAEWREAPLHAGVPAPRDEALAVVRAAAPLERRPDCPRAALRVLRRRSSVRRRAVDVLRTASIVRGRAPRAALSPEAHAERGRPLTQRRLLAPHRGDARGELRQRHRAGRDAEVVATRPRPAVGPTISLARVEDAPDAPQSGGHSGPRLYVIGPVHGRPIAYLQHELAGAARAESNGHRRGHVAGP